jgi:CheY-like chemotaxis protein
MGMMDGAEKKFSDLLLVVDDDMMMRLLMRETLEEGGFAVVEAANGTEALAVFADVRPGYPLKAGQLTYDCRYPTMHGMPVTGGRGFRGLKPLWYNGVPP